MNLCVGRSWKYALLGDVCVTSAGGTPLKLDSKNYDGGTIPWLMSGEVGQRDVVAATKFITEKVLASSSAKLFPASSVLIAMYGATAEEARPWIANYELRLETMVQKIEAQFPGGCQIFLANIYDPTDGIGDTERARLPAWKDSLKILAAYNDAISRCAQKHPNLHLIDIHSAFLGHGIHCTQFWREHYDWHDPHYWFYENLEDPNERGYDVMRRLFLIEIAKVLNQSTF